METESWGNEELKKFPFVEIKILHFIFFSLKKFVFQNKFIDDAIRKNLRSRNKPMGGL